MSILDGNLNNNPIPLATGAADRLKVMTRQTYQMLVNNYTQGTQLFWTNSNASPADIAAALGTDASEVFTLHYLIGQVLGQVRPADIAEAQALIGSATLNQDGTVTVN